MRLISADEMQAIDQGAIQTLGVPGTVLMENAGSAATEIFCREFGDLFPGPVLIVAGKGNNGGDGYVMARRLAEQGWNVQTLVLGQAEAIQGDAAVMLGIQRKMNLPTSFILDGDQLRNGIDLAAPEVIVDALLGTGLKATVTGLYAEAIDLINSSGVPVFSVDIPSGVDASNGRICGSAVQADLTVTFDQAKIGHGSYPGAGCVGALEVVDIGIPRFGRPELTSKVLLTGAEQARDWLPSRSSAGHKGSFGHLLLLAGSPGKTGAAALAGAAALRSGCGLVTAAVPAAVHAILEVKLTEVMTSPLADREGLLCLQAKPALEKLLIGRQALAIGPGLGQSDDLKELLRWLVVEANLPLVIDADGLNLLAGQLDCLQQRQGPLPVLTPHPGEMARLCGRSVAEIEADRFQLAVDFAARHKVVLLLKGPRTLIADPEGAVCINSSGNDGLSSGGSGDVLTGLLGGLLAQGLDSFAAAALAAWLHGRAAERIARHQGTAGMAASDLLPQLPAARRELTEGEDPC